MGAESFVADKDGNFYYLYYIAIYVGLRRTSVNSYYCP